MNCRECLEQFSSLSADNVAADSALLMREHLAACPECKHEWHVFESTLFLLSTAEQPLPNPQISGAMWHCCSEYIFQKVEAERQSHNSSRFQPGLKGWIARQPRWSWATLGGALAVLGAAWFMAPHDEAFSPNNDLSPQSPGTLVTFQRPSVAASGLVNHHSAMATDPFTDSVGSTMVSYSATSPTAASSVNYSSAIPAPRP